MACERIRFEHLRVVDELGELPGHSQAERVLLIPGGRCRRACVVDADAVLAELLRTVERCICRLEESVGAERVERMTGDTG